MKKHILGIQIANPAEAGEKLQDILTKYGCTIRTRMGLHNDEEDGSEGLIILELMDDLEEITNLKKALSQLDNVVIKEMVFE
jgi:hypothetical protein